jgi:DNA-binding NtrC family response regulator
VTVLASPAGAADEGVDRSNQALSSLEKQHILKVIAETGGNKARAARQLGLSRRALYRRLERYGIAHPDPRPSFADGPA